MRIRWPVAAAFTVVLLIAAFLGFSPQPESLINDKLQHFLVFFFLTLIFYWIVDTTKRRVLNMTVIFSLVVDVGSELLQMLAPSRTFDVFDILANLLGSAAALGLNILYHKRQLARKAAQNRYASVPSAANGDVEMGPEPVATEEAAEGDIANGK